jgi:hypothetical protein
MEGFVMDPNAFTTPHTWVQGSGGADDIYCRVCGVSKSVESKASEGLWYEISKHYKEVVEDGRIINYQCNSCGKKINVDDEFGDEKDDDILIQELRDHQEFHGTVFESKASEDTEDEKFEDVDDVLRQLKRESKASEDLTFAGRGELNTIQDVWNAMSNDSRYSLIYQLGHDSYGSATVSFVNGQELTVTDIQKVIDRDEFPDHLLGNIDVEHMKRVAGLESKASEDYEVDVDEYEKTGEPVEKLPIDKRNYDVEAGSEDHVCAECGFVTSDNSEYIDHLHAHEVNHG